MTAGPSVPTTLEPVVKRPTPITEPAVIVTASRMPNVRFRPPAWGLDASILVSVIGFIFYIE
mgnify:CR=1 FL=1|jgi:hypothetical protein